MKKLSVLMLSLVMTFGAMAQNFSLIKGEKTFEQKAIEYAKQKRSGVHTQTPKTNPAVTITINDIQAATVNATFTPAENVVKYYFCGTETGMIEDLVEFYEMFGLSMTVAEYITYVAQDSSNVEMTVDVEGFTPNTASSIYVAALLNDGTYEVVTSDFTTASIGGSGDAALTINVYDIAETSAFISITPNDQSAYYGLILTTQAELDGMGFNNDSIMAYFNGNEYQKYYFELDEEMPGLDPSTTYLVYAIAFNVDGVASELYEIPFTTLAYGGEGLAEVAMTATNPTANSFDISFVPNDQTNYYYYVIADQTFYNDLNLSTSDDVVAWAQANQEKNFGELGGTVSDLDMGTEYICYAIPFNANNELGTVSSTTITTLSLGGTGVAEVEIIVENVTATTFDVAFEMNEETAYYYYLIAEESILEQYGLTTQEAILEYFAQNGEKSYENLGGTISDCVNGSLMKVYTFAYNGNNELGTVNLVDIIMGEGVVGLNDVMTNVDVNIYPNPANKFINVSSLSIIDRVQITNVLGQVVMVKEIGANGANINIENLESGNYFVTIYSNDAVATKKLLVK
ncbi:MAG: T9SS type A sorting domain-containing protein [Bacteroidales bacterium]|nr:T9SS type A sorting domain-containing protein [Bacteroidales bacterium]